MGTPGAYVLFTVSGKGWPPRGHSLCNVKAALNSRETASRSKLVRLLTISSRPATHHFLAILVCANLDALAAHVRYRLEVCYHFVVQLSAAYIGCASHVHRPRTALAVVRRVTAGTDAYVACGGVARDSQGRLLLYRGQGSSGLLQTSWSCRIITSP
eukprot:scaffold3202_cov407-Prasinococcus_capsulatus_cf.AAC.11